MVRLGIGAHFGEERVSLWLELEAEGWAVGVAWCWGQSWSWLATHWSVMCLGESGQSICFLIYYLLCAYHADTALGAPG